jgi:hypothetical protein
MKLGNNQVLKLCVGAQLVQKAYLGSTLVFSTQSEFLPSSLFGPTDQGYWYDNQDLSTMFQDVAGTIPVTAVEQPVGRQLDKSGKGNHRISPGPTTSRPILRARYNLLTFSEDFSNPAWLKTNLSPSGKKLIPTATSGSHLIRQTPPSGIIPTRVTARVKADGYGGCALWDDNGRGAYFNLLTGSVISRSGGAIGSIVADTDGYFLCTIDFTSSSNGWCAVYMLNNSMQFNFTGDGTSGIILDRISYVNAQDAHLPYQRITTATDYDTVGFPLYLDTDGADDWMRTAATVDFSGSDKVTLIQGLHKRNDAAAMFAELSTDVNSNAGGYALVTGNSVGGLYSTKAGSSGGWARFGPSQYPAPDTAIISISHSLGSGLSRIWRNNVVGMDSTTGSGNFRNDFVFFYSRAGTGVRFNGRDYGQFAISRLLSDAERNQVESWLNSKMGGIY